MRISKLSYKWISPTAIFLMFALCSISNTQLVSAQTGTLELTVFDRATDEIVPARVEIQGSDEVYYVAEDALLVGGDCDMSDQGAGLFDLKSTLASFSRKIENPYTKSIQFYSTGKSLIHLPGGTATIRVFKGPEYELYVDKVDIQADKTIQHEIQLSRWINMPAKGWYSSDDHLHIPRPVKELDPYISKMMQAEDIHVANLLQMGKVLNSNIAPQHSHGPESRYQEKDYILAAGQENPRTHFLGHTITLGAKTALHFPEKYLIYRLLWQEAVNQGGINGYAHAWAQDGTVVAPHNGLAVILPHDLMHFIEVLQFNRSDYEIWYDILNLGFQVTPTAGTDFPCVEQTIPGHERFYTRVDGRFTYNNWLEGVRNGRTFVTTGPILEFKINGKDIGSEIIFDQASSIQIEGSVLFDTQKDNVKIVEIIQNGEVIKRISRVSDEGKMDFTISHPVNESSWFALRGYGQTIIERLSVNPLHFRSFKPTSNVHSAPIYVTIPNTQALAKSAHSKKVAKAWLARLEDLEAMLAEDNIEYLSKQLVKPNFDAVPKDVLINNRTELLEEIQDAKVFFIELSR